MVVIHLLVAGFCALGGQLGWGKDGRLSDSVTCSFLILGQKCLMSVNSFIVNLKTSSWKWDLLTAQCLQMKPIWAGEIFHKTIIGRLKVFERFWLEALPFLLKGVPSGMKPLRWDTRPDQPMRFLPGGLSLSGLHSPWRLGFSFYLECSFWELLFYDLSRAGHCYLAYAFCHLGAWGFDPECQRQPTRSSFWVFACRESRGPWGTQQMGPEDAHLNGDGGLSPPPLLNTILAI